MQHFEVHYRDESGDIVETVLVKRVKRAQLADLITLQQQLLQEFLRVNGAVGAAIASPVAWSVITKIAALLPVVGQEKPGLDLSPIEDDTEQLGRIFFTESAYTELIEEGAQIKPSLISGLNSLDYRGDLGKAIETLRKELEVS